jgi:serpin B
MRVCFGLLLVSLGAFMSRETSAAESKPSENQFALEMYAQLDREWPGRNLFFSPTSVSLALAMTAAGARGPTQAEMAKVLDLDADLAQAHAHCRRLLEQCSAVGQTRAYQLRVANRLWGQKGHPIRPEFLALTREFYGAEMLLLDFAQAEAASREINQWVAQQTNDKIKGLVPPGALDALTRLVLTNAVYFKGDWVAPFEKRSTRDEDFSVSAQQKVQVPLMRQKATFDYAEEDTLQVLELPYKGQELSMVLLLPKEVDGLPALEKSLTADKLAGLLSRLRSVELMAFIPRFKMETSFGLNPTLEAMGMKRAFHAQADFSGISSGEGLHISAVIHKAYLDVNEQGTEAAAATGVMMKIMAARRPLVPIPVFRADRPFLFAIRDTTNGSVLFMGRLTNPTK